MARTSPSDAVNNPVSRPGRELLSDDLPVRDVPPLLDPLDREDDVIVASADLLAKEYADELAFNEELLDIVLHRGREKHAPLFEQFGVNGQIVWVKVETPTRIKRKFVEVMARSMPMDITTTSGEDPSDALTFNRVERSLASNFSFSILRDPSPKGAAWLAKVRRES